MDFGLCESVKSNLCSALCSAGHSVLHQEESDSGKLLKHDFTKQAVSKRNNEYVGGSVFMASSCKCACWQ